MVDYQSLIEFCKAFENHRHMVTSKSLKHNTSKKHTKSLNPLSHPFCNHSPFVAIDIIILFFAIVVLVVLTIPYFNFIFCEFIPSVFLLIGHVIHNAPVPYGVGGLVFAFVMFLCAWEIILNKSSKCGNPCYKGLWKAVEFDIQLESEECVKNFLKDGYGVQAMEFGLDHKELKAELKKIAPPNGRTVLIFRASCGCLTGRMEVWGPKRVRTVKK